MQTNKKIKRDVQEYYGETLEKTGDLKTSACCLRGNENGRVQEILASIHPEVLSRFYGCGSPIPENIQGKTVLDLGCGTGRDSFVMAKMVGQEGHVIGVDMTENQLVIAKRYENYHRDKFGYEKANTEFLLGDIENLKALNIRDSSIDVVISNCVLNLSPDKEKVFSEIFRVLKPKGELLFADIFSNLPIPTEHQMDPVLRGECLSGAMTLERFKNILKNLEIDSFDILESDNFEVMDPELKRMLADYEFLTMTIRTFNHPSGESVGCC